MPFVAPLNPEELVWGSTSTSSEVEILRMEYIEGQLIEVANILMKEIKEGKTEEIKDLASIHEIYLSYEKEIEEKIKSIEIFKSMGQSLEAEIISSSIDADKLDYLRRDSYHTGVAYGVFDIERILRTLTTIEEGDKKHLGILEKGAYALESYRLARYSMYIQVYEHKTRLIADDIFIRMVKLAIDEGIIDRDSINLMKYPERSVNEYLKLDDCSIIHKILSNENGIKSKSKEFAERLLKRNFSSYVIPSLLMNVVYLIGLEEKDL